MSTVPTDFLDELLDPLAQCFTPAVAQDVVNLRFDTKFQSRLECLRQKANEGTLAADEQAEYEALTETLDFIAVLQAKSRRMLQLESSNVEELRGTRLTPRDRNLFLQMLDLPPEPNEALQRAAERFRERRG